MDDDLKQFQAALQQGLALLGQLKARVDNIELKNQEQDKAIDKLGEVYGLEWVVEFDDWVSSEKLKALKDKPRD